MTKIPTRPLGIAIFTLGAVACRSESAQRPITPSASVSVNSIPSPPLVETPGSGEDLPAEAKPIAPADIAGEFACGPFHTKELAAKEQAMLEDRIRVRWFPNTTLTGNETSAKLELKRGEHTIFIGSRETFEKGDDKFARRAAKAGKFDAD